MTNQKGRTDIVAFLLQAKKLLFEGKYTFVPRNKNLQSLAAYGLSINDAKDEILELTTSNYYKGPKPDFDQKRGGDIWEFKTNIGNQTFYIKLKIQTQEGEDVLKCLSFHRDEFD